MNEDHGIWWSILDAITRLLAFVLAAGLGWLTRKFSKIEERMTSMESDYVKRDAMAVAQIATLRAYHEANIQRLSSIETTTSEISKKQDQLLLLMLQERREK